MFTNFIKTIGLIALITPGVRASEQRKFPGTGSITCCEQNNQASLVAQRCAFVAATGVVAGVAYNSSSSIRKAVDSSASYLIGSVAPRLVMKIEKIKDEGPTKSDLIKGSSFLGACCVLKKLSDFFHIKDYLQGDTSETEKALIWCKQEYKKILAGLGIITGAAYTLWRLQQEPHVLEKLKLSSEQWAQCWNSHELNSLLKAKDYVALLMHDALTYLLTDEQRKIQQQLIEEQSKEFSLDFLLDDLE